MIKYCKFVLILLLFLFLSVFFVKDFLSFKANASDLTPAYFLFERTQTNEQTDIILMLTPSLDFTVGGELKISFLDDVGSWCGSPVAMSVAGIDSSAIDKEGWEIDLPLPERSGFSFDAECTPGDSFLGTYDTILIENLGELDAGVSYGLLILKNPGFRTSTLTGEKSVFIELSDGLNNQNAMLVITLMQSDSLTILAKVLNVSTITCTVSKSSLYFFQKE